MKILVVNAGSSSHKLSLFDMHDKQSIDPLWTGVLDWGQSSLDLLAKTADGRELKKEMSKSQVQEGLNDLLNSLSMGSTKVIDSLSAIERIGHRVVHGGKLFRQPVQINQQVKNEIRKLISLAPLHNSVNLEGIEYMENFFPNTPQIAVFDTSFHHTIPPVANTYPIPYHWKEEGIQKYGFHGISHQYCAGRVAELCGQPLDHLKIISCHLGNGSSLCAIREGKSVDTTMGFTPLEGLMMGTRCGSIDPGILLYLLREKGINGEELNQILNFESGLKGICGSSDMREIRDKDDSMHRLAFDMYVYRLKTYIGAYLAHLNGVDAICFTGGIGEHAFQVREAVCRGLNFAGIEIDQQANNACQSDQDIKHSQSNVSIFVIRTREEWMIAKCCFDVKIDHAWLAANRLA